MNNLQIALSPYKGSTIALYGLSIETKKTIDILDTTFDIIGLLDGFTQEGYLYGKQIISLSECLDKKVKIIIVVARPGSCRAITKRIGRFCLENEIILLDVRGKNLLENSRVAYDFKEINGTTKKELCELSNTYDVISFDLFDTLITRQILNPTDVIELMDCVLKERGFSIENFYEKRLAAEKQLSKSGAPTLKEIYEFILAAEEIELSAEQLVDIEWETDCNLIIPRRDVVDFMTELYNQGKAVYIITDTYYRRIQIVDMLKKNGIFAYTDILVSCEYRTSKTQELFSKLKDIIGDSSCLHIGDDLVADVESAVRNGYSSCQIFSGLDLFEKLGYLGFSENMDSLNDKIKLGMFVAKLFNSPFQFETSDGILRIETNQQIGYLLMAPMISDFVLWFYEVIKTEKIKNIWFGARDGYLIKKMYELLDAESSSVYFLTSRMSVIRACIDNMDDIRYVAEMKYSGSLQQQLHQRFGIEVEERVTQGKTIYDFKDEILNNSLKNKDNYLKYIDSLKMKPGRIAFFDFVAKGTVQMYIGKLLDHALKGVYFLQLEKEYMKDKKLDILSFYENGEKENSTIYENYYILEPILTSKDASIVGFNQYGEPCYANETRNEQDIYCFQQVQAGIEEYFKDYLRICPEVIRKPNKKMDEICLELIHKVKIQCSEFLNLTVEDPFFNRMTRMEDLL